MTVLVFCLALLRVIGPEGSEKVIPVPGNPSQERVSRRTLIEIGEGAPVNVDGIVEAAEWADADSVLVATWAGAPSVVHLKHDGEALLFAITGIDPYRPLVPEIMLAVAELGETSWGPGHWWFHASGQDCWARGAYNRWSTCVPETPEWEASNPPEEREPGTPLAWEVRIPFSTLELDPLSNPEIGLAFDLTDTATSWFFWPARAQLGIPSTWAIATLVP